MTTDWRNQFCFGDKLDDESIDRTRPDPSLDPKVSCSVPPVPRR